MSMSFSRSDTGPQEVAPSLTGRDILVLSPTPTWPLDAGNRKRIHRVCSALQSRGARIHFVYYPFEWWFTAVPQQHLDCMAAQWDAFFLAPVTRALQAPPKAEHHEIDEWWDPAIEPLLRWLLQRGRYDAFIVNYGYLSRALEMAPAGTLRILDTHDRFSGRKELLAQLGVAPEYFYTTAEQESIALERADLVWAIKDEEASFFRSISTRPVITVPHAEEPVPLPPRRSTDGDDLILGMVGARNSLNLRNAQRFIEEALPILRRRLAPVRIRFGGSMCTDLANIDPLPAGVELAGRFGDAADFYAGVDAILVPISHSTGLKIKAVEAFALGLPVIALRHAVEGIPVSHPFHRCDSMAQMAQCCLALARDRGLLEELRSATLKTRAQLAEAQLRALDETARRICRPLTVVMTVAPEFAEADGAYALHVLETVDYLRYLGPVVLYVDRPLKGDFGTWCHRFANQAEQLKIVFSPSAAAAMGLGADRRRSAPFPLFHSVEPLRAVLQRLPHRLLWVTDLPDDLLEGQVPQSLLAGTYLRVDALQLLDRWSPPKIAAVLSEMPAAIPLSGADAVADASVPAAAAARARIVPFWRRLGGGRWAAWQSDPSRPPEVWITASAHRPLQALGWALAAQTLQPEQLVVRLLFRDGASLAAAAPVLAEQPHVVGDTLQSAMESLVRRQLRPRALLDVAAEPASFGLLQESAWRLGLPWLQAWSGQGDGALRAVFATADEPSRLGELIRALAALLAADPDPESLERRSHPAFANDAGWQWVWKSISVRRSLAL